MNRRTLMIGMAVWMGIATGGVWADDDGPEVVTMSAVIRDFPSSHGDFESFVHSQFSRWYVRSGADIYSYKNLVKSELGENGKPQFNTDLVLPEGVPAYTDGRITGWRQEGVDEGSEARVTVFMGPKQIWVFSTKDLSNVIIKLDNGVTHKFDELTGYQGHYTIPEQYGTDREIVTCWIKSGTYQSNDLPGAGYRIDVWECRNVIPMQSKESFEQWFRSDEEVNKAVKFDMELTDPDGDGVYTYDKSGHGNYFFPIDNKLFGNSGYDTQGIHRNFHFTTEVRTKFTYTDPAERLNDMVFRFSGDDDVWVFINGKLAVDLGSIHPECFGEVNLDEKAQELGLEAGKTYDFHFFLAERHTNQSNCLIETTIQFLEPGYD